jgi:hypothetical protein
MDGSTVTVERTMAAPPAMIFALLADAANHPVLDGSGAVKSPRTGGGQPLHLGSVFDMSMKMGLPYETRNTVVEYEQDRRIAWRTTVELPRGLEFGGRVWRWELEPSGDRTRVRVTWDITTDTLRPVFARVYFPGKTEENLTRSLERLERQVAPTAA